jgi:hypothetical protein
LNLRNVRIGDFHDLETKFEIISAG